MVYKLTVIECSARDGDSADGAFRKWEMGRGKLLITAPLARWQFQAGN